MAKAQLYILHDPHDRDRVQALRAVMPIKPKAKPNEQQSERKKKDSEGQAVWWTMYELNRAIRRFEGTTDDADSQFDYDLWIDPLHRWIEANQEWAYTAKIDAISLSDGMDAHWNESVGEHRNPLQAALHAYKNAPEAYAPDNLRSPNQRHAATFCVCLANVKRDSGSFFLAQGDLGEAIGVTGAGAWNCLQKLKRVGLLDCVQTGINNPFGGQASEWRLAGYLLQFYSVSDLQDLSASRISGEIRAASGLSPEPSNLENKDHDLTQDHDHDLTQDHDQPVDLEVEALFSLGSGARRIDAFVPERVPRRRVRIGDEEPTRLGSIPAQGLGERSMDAPTSTKKPWGM